MVAKIVTGGNFKGAIDYITDIYGKDKQKKGARIICHSAGIPPGADNRTMGLLLDAYARKGDHNIDEPVRHFILSFSKYDAPKLTDEFISLIFLEFLSRMGYRNTEFIAARHQSKKNPHLHGITLRIDRDGNVISDSYEEARAKRIALELTKKYGLHISSGKVDVSRDRLRGKDKAKYKIYDAVCAAMKKTDTWSAFEAELKENEISMKFHVNNVTGRLMGISFSADGFSFAGSKVDKTLTLSRLEEHFGKLNEIVHESVHDHYDQKREEYLHRLPNNQYFTALRLVKSFEDLYPEGVPDWKLPDVRTSIGDNYYEKLEENGHVIPSKDGKSVFLPLAVLLFVMLDNYQGQLSVGGGGGSSSEDRKKDDEDERWKFRFNMSVLKGRSPGKSKKPHYKPHF
ncbi:MAG: relaxase/mobilization nuclease domain-containing protein [Bacteroidaceae bacterium]|nr:relaxase/mobilization nuclease domain-containing protein [Bacteroidaceae bacterium]